MCILIIVDYLPWTEMPETQNGAHYSNQHSTVQVHVAVHGMHYNSVVLTTSDNETCTHK